ncbi:MAG: hypothetical protein IH991_13835, partial [Planctomycetes bacterium]|nr:hypothetical protein [Planctomycetota bacterium]
MRLCFGLLASVMVVCSYARNAWAEDDRAPESPVALRFPRLAFQVGDDGPVDEWIRPAGVRLELGPGFGGGGEILDQDLMDSDIGGTRIEGADPGGGGAQDP